MKTNNPKLQPQTPAPKKDNPSPTLASGTFSEHIKELRGRIFWVFAAFLIASAAAYHYREPLIEIVLWPLADQSLIYLTPGGGFSFIFQVTMYAGLLVTTPLVAYHLYGFIKPALPAGSRHSTLGVVGVAALLMTLGVLFGYFIAVPAALKFLSEFAGDFIVPNLTADSYLTFFLSYVGGLGLLFQLPLLLMLWHWINPMTPGGLLKSEKFIIPFAFIAAAIITPTPDVMNQTMIAAPILIIYQFGVVAVLISIRRERRRQKHQAATLQPMPELVPVPVAYPEPGQKELEPEAAEPVTQPAVSDDYLPQFARRYAQSLGSTVLTVVWPSQAAELPASAAHPSLSSRQDRTLLQLQPVPHRPLQVPRREVLQANGVE